MVWSNGKQKLVPEEEEEERYVMGTKTHFIRDYRSSIDPRRNNNNGMMSFYHETQNPGSFSSSIRCFPGHEFAKMRQTILQHETLFRAQLNELHRLYRKQKELMDGIRRREIERNVAKNSYNEDTELSLGTVRVSPIHTDALTLDLMPNSDSSSTFPADKRKASENGVIEDYFSCKSSTFFQSRHPPLNLHCSMVPTRKRKLFGVELSEGNNVSVDAKSNVSTSTENKVDSSEEMHHRTPWFSNSLQVCSSESARILPSFLRKSKFDDDTGKGTKIPYFMNLESLQNCTQSFFKKAESKIENPRCDEQDARDLNIQKDLSTSGTYIDLNMSLDDEDFQREPESKTYDSGKVTECVDEDCDRIAAETILSMSVYEENEAPRNSLKWLAELILSASDESESKKSVPFDMDYFEFMTLKLKDCKSKHHDYQSVISKNLNESDVVEKDNVFTRSRRRGKPRKDFQRDILPGLVTLSRLEVSEDFHVFEEATKSCASKRSFRGQKRCFIGSSMTMQPPEKSLREWGRRTRRMPRQRCCKSNNVAVKC